MIFYYPFSFNFFRMLLSLHFYTFLNTFASCNFSSFDSVFQLWIQYLLWNTCYWCCGHCCWEPLTLTHWRRSCVHFHTPDRSSCHNQMDWWSWAQSMYHCCFSYTFYHCTSRNCVCWGCSCHYRSASLLSVLQCSASPSPAGLHTLIYTCKSCKNCILGIWSTETIWPIVCWYLTMRPVCACWISHCKTSGITDVGH